MSFEIKNNDEHIDYKCNLQGQRCIGITKAGHQCNRRTVKMLPTCYQHTKSKYGVEIKKSQIPNAGDGLFTLKEFKANDTIVPYSGEPLSNQQLVDRYGPLTAPYGANESYNHNVDTACKRSLGSFINDAKNSNFTNNARWSVNYNLPHGQQISIKARVNIPAHREIFVDYGREYWDGVRDYPNSTVITRKYKFRHL